MEYNKIILKEREKRIIRVLEIYHKTGKTKTQQEIESRKNGVKYDYKIILERLLCAELLDILGVNQLLIFF